MEQISNAKQRKIDRVEELVGAYSSPSSWVFLLNYKGLNAEKTFALRNEVRKVGGKVMVSKNTLNSIAFPKAGFNGLNEFLSGQIVVVCASDPVSIAKAVTKYSEAGSVELVACSNKNNVYDAALIAELANLPSLDALRSKLLGTLLALPTKLVRTLSEPASMVARICNAKAKAM